LQLCSNDVRFTLKTEIFENMANTIMKFKIIAILIYLFSSLIISQTDTLTLSSDEIQSLVNKIAIKLLLNDNQKNELSKILSDYSSEFKKLRIEGEYSDASKEKLVEDLNAEIKLLLDDKQKMKYDILRNDWLKSLISEEND
jgi:hypothetical protein